MNRKPETIGFWRGRLPHWEVEDGRYFVTIHLAGAIPEQGKARIHALSEEHNRCLTSNSQCDSDLQLMRTIFRELELWLDQAVDNTWLRAAPVSEMVAEAIQNRIQRSVWEVFEWVVMPNHLIFFSASDKER